MIVLMAALLERLLMFFEHEVDDDEEDEEDGELVLPLSKFSLADVVEMPIREWEAEEVATVVVMVDDGGED